MLMVELDTKPTTVTKMEVMQKVIQVNLEANVCWDCMHHFRGNKNDKLIWIKC